jgi:hypothetical protein
VSFVAVEPVHETVPVVSSKASGTVPMSSIGSGGQSLLVGYASAPLRSDDPGVQVRPWLGPPTQVPSEQSGHGWMPGMLPVGSVAVSPVRWNTAESGSSRLVAPVSQANDPVGGPATTFSTQWLRGMVLSFGTASGAPSRHPGAVQFRRLPVCAVGPSVAV